MNMEISIVIYGFCSGITVPIGGIMAYYFDHYMNKGEIKSEISHALMSFGSGVMLSAIALVLVPKGMDTLHLTPMVISFLLGSLIFMGIDMYLTRKGGKVATLLAMMMDYIPESIALGAVFSINLPMAKLLAIFIGLQNLPEAFNAYRDLVSGGLKEKTTLITFFFLSFSGIGGALVGHFFLSSYQGITANLMTFASGGILYLLIRDIIPDSKLDKNYIVSIGATLGFLVGIIREKLI